MHGVVLLAIIPGLPQVLLGRPKKAVALLIITAGIALTAALSGSYLIRSLMLFMYLATAIPAGLEAHGLADTGGVTISTDARWYVTLLLLTTGFTALPLLWQSPNFSRRAKIAWSVAVPLLAAAFFSGLAVYGHRIEERLREMLSPAGRSEQVAGPPLAAAVGGPGLGGVTGPLERRPVP